MPFGLRNAPATFFSLVSKLLLGLDAFYTAYLDDIIILVICVRSIFSICGLSCHVSELPT